MTRLLTANEPPEVRAFAVLRIAGQAGVRTRALLGFLGEDVGDRTLARMSPWLETVKYRTRLRGAA